MKALILAGGTGSRLRPITHTTQKQLVPIVNKPVIQHVIEDLKSVGITEIGVVIGGKFPKKIKEFLKNGESFGVDVTYILQGEPLGLAHAVGCASDFVGDESFVVYFGDTIFGEEITKTLVNSFEDGVHDAGVILQHVEEPSRFGIADISGKDINRILEKPDNPPSNLAYVGVVAFSPEVFDYIRDLEPSWRGELELTQTLHEMVVDNKPVFWDTVDGLWKDVGTPKDVVETNRELMTDLEHDIKKGVVGSETNITSPVQMGRGAVIEGKATVEGPVVIGKDTTVSGDAHVGPYASIGDGCTVDGSRIANSIVMEDAEIAGTQSIVESIIGSNATVRSNTGGEYKQVLGEDSRIVGKH